MSKKEFEILSAFYKAAAAFYNSQPAERIGSRLTISGEEAADFRKHSVRARKILKAWKQKFGIK